MELSRTIETETGEMIVKRVSVPLGLEEIMESFAKEVILKKPKDIYLFASEYFTRILHLRDSGLYRGNVRSAKMAVKHPSKSMMKQTIFSPTNGIDTRKPTTPYYLRQTTTTASKIDENRRAKIQEHLRKKRELSEVNDSKGNKVSRGTNTERSRSNTTKKTEKNEQFSSSESGKSSCDKENIDVSSKKIRKSSKSVEIEVIERKSSRKRSSSISSRSGESSRSIGKSNVPDEVKSSRIGLEICGTNKLNQTAEKMNEISESIEINSQFPKECANISSTQDEHGRYEVSHSPTLVTGISTEQSIIPPEIHRENDSKIEAVPSVNDGENQTRNKEENMVLVYDLSQDVEAIVKIQNLWRGFRARKKMKLKKQEHKTPDNDSVRKQVISTITANDISQGSNKTTIQNKVEEKTLESEEQMGLGENLQERELDKEVHGKELRSETPSETTGVLDEKSDNLTGTNEAAEEKIINETEKLGDSQKHEEEINDEKENSNNTSEMTKEPSKFNDGLLTRNEGSNEEEIEIIKNDSTRKNSNENIEITTKVDEELGKTKIRNEDNEILTEKTDKGVEGSSSEIFERSGNSGDDHEKYQTETSKSDILSSTQSGNDNSPSNEEVQGTTQETHLSISETQDSEKASGAEASDKPEDEDNDGLNLQTDTTAADKSLTDDALSREGIIGPKLNCNGEKIEGGPENTTSVITGRNGEFSMTETVGTDEPRAVKKIAISLGIDTQQNKEMKEGIKSSEEVSDVDSKSNKSTVDNISSEILDSTEKDVTESETVSSMISSKTQDEHLNSANSENGKREGIQVESGLKKPSQENTEVVDFSKSSKETATEGQIESVPDSLSEGKPNEINEKPSSSILSANRVDENVMPFEWTSKEPTQGSERIQPEQEPELIHMNDENDHSGSVENYSSMIEAKKRDTCSKKTEDIDETHNSESNKNNATEMKRINFKEIGTVEILENSIGNVQSANISSEKTAIEDVNHVTTQKLNGDTQDVQSDKIGHMYESIVSNEINSGESIEKIALVPKKEGNVEETERGDNENNSKDMKVENLNIEKLDNFPTTIEETRDGSAKDESEQEEKLVTDTTDDLLKSEEIKPEVADTLHAGNSGLVDDSSLSKSSEDMRNNEEQTKEDERNAKECININDEDQKIGDNSLEESGRNFSKEDYSEALKSSVDSEPMKSDYEISEVSGRISEESKDHNELVPNESPLQKTSFNKNEGVNTQTSLKNCEIAKNFEAEIDCQSSNEIHVEKSEVSNHSKNNTQNDTQKNGDNEESVNLEKLEILNMEEERGRINEQYNVESEESDKLSFQGDSKVKNESQENIKQSEGHLIENKKLAELENKDYRTSESQNTEIINQKLISNETNKEVENNPKKSDMKDNRDIPDNSVISSLDAHIENSSDSSTESKIAQNTNESTRETKYLQDKDPNFASSIAEKNEGNHFTKNSIQYHRSITIEASDKEKTENSDSRKLTTNENVDENNASKDGDIGGLSKENLTENVGVDDGNNAAINADNVVTSEGSSMEESSPRTKEQRNFVSLKNRINSGSNEKPGSMDGESKENSVYEPKLPNGLAEIVTTPRQKPGSKDGRGNLSARKLQKQKSIQNTNIPIVNGNGDPQTKLKKTRSQSHKSSFDEKRRGMNMRRAQSEDSTNNGRQKQRKSSISPEKRASSKVLTDKNIKLISKTKMRPLNSGNVDSKRNSLEETTMVANNEDNGETMGGSCEAQNISDESGLLDHFRESETERMKRERLGEEHSKETLQTSSHTEKDEDNATMEDLKVSSEWETRTPHSNENRGNSSENTPLDLSSDGMTNEGCEKTERENSSEANRNNIALEGEELGSKNGADGIVLTEKVASKEEISGKENISLERRVENETKLNHNYSAVPLKKGLNQEFETSSNKNTEEIENISLDQTRNEDSKNSEKTEENNLAKVDEGTDPKTEELLSRDEKGGELLPEKSVSKEEIRLEKNNSLDPNISRKESEVGHNKFEEQVKEELSEDSGLSSDEKRPVKNSNLCEIKSAIEIQKIWRGFQARKQFLNLLNGKLELEHNNSIHKTTDENKNLISNGTRFSAPEKEILDSATNTNGNQNIGASFSSGSVENNASACKLRARKSKKISLANLDLSSDIGRQYVNQALKIQSAWRAYKVRKNIRDVEDKINEIEHQAGNELPKSIHLSDSEILKAVTKIQAGLRGYIARKHVKNLRERNKSLDGIQEESNCDDEIILEALKKLDGVDVPDSMPELGSNEDQSNASHEDIQRIGELDAKDEGNKENSLKNIKDENSVSKENNLKSELQETERNEESSASKESLNDAKIEAHVENNSSEQSGSDSTENSGQNKGKLKKSKAADNLVKLAEQFEQNETNITHIQESNEKESSEEYSIEEKCKKVVSRPSTSGNKAVFELPGTGSEEKDLDHSVSKENFDGNFSNSERTGSPEIISQSLEGKSREGNGIDQKKNNIDGIHEINKIEVTDVRRSNSLEIGKEKQNMILNKALSVDVVKTSGNNFVNDKDHPRGIKDQSVPRPSFAEFMKKTLDTDEIHSESAKDAVNKEESAQKSLDSEDERLRAKSRYESATKIQSLYRGYRARKNVENFKVKTRGLPEHSTVDEIERANNIAINWEHVGQRNNEQSTEITSTSSRNDNSVVEETVPRQSQSATGTTQTNRENTEGAQENVPAGVEVLTTETQECEGVVDDASSDVEIETRPSIRGVPVYTQKVLSNKSRAESDRGMEQTKRNNSTLRNKNMEVEAATKIQAGFRGYKVRKQLKMKETPKNEMSKKTVRRKSSGLLADTQSKKQKENVDLQEKSAVKIQAGVRGFLVRRRVKKPKVSEEST